MFRTYHVTYMSHVKYCHYFETSSITTKEGCAPIVSVGVTSEMLHKENVDLLIGPFCADGLET